MMPDSLKQELIQSIINANFREDLCHILENWRDTNPIVASSTLDFLTDKNSPFHRLEGTFGEAQMKVLFKYLYRFLGLIGLDVIHFIFLFKLYRKSNPFGILFYSSFWRLEIWN